MRVVRSRELQRTGDDAGPLGSGWLPLALVVVLLALLVAAFLLVLGVRRFPERR